MADSVDNLEADLGRIASRGEPSPAIQIRRQLRGKHVCPFCGTTRETDLGPCQHCSLEDTPTTRAATRTKLGPWYVLQSRNPSAPGMNFATLMMLVQKGRVTARSVLRGPTTGQFWKHAAKVKGVAREFGLCWNCGGDIARNGRACPSCKRMQEPPLNPDVLLEPGEISADDLTEQMWAADAPSSQVGSAPPRSAHTTPVERLMNKGGLRREVTTHPHADSDDGFGQEAQEPMRQRPAPRPSANGAPRNGNGHGNAGANGNGHATSAHPHAAEAHETNSHAPVPRRSAPSTDGDDLVASLSSALPEDDGLDGLGPRRRGRSPQTHGTGLPPRPQVMARGGLLSDANEDLSAPSQIEMSVFQMPYNGRQAKGGGVISKLFKVLFIAILLGGIGLGAMCYFDESVRNKTVGYWEQFKTWVLSLTKNSRPATTPAPTPTSTDEEAGDGSVAQPAASRALGSPTGGTSSGTLTSPKDAKSALGASGVRSKPTAGGTPAVAKESPIQKAFKLFGDAADCESRGDYAEAVRIYDQIAELKLRPEQLPIGVDARANVARRKAAEKAK